MTHASSSRISLPLNPGYSLRGLFTPKKYANSEIGLDFTVSVIMLRPSRSIVEGVFMRRLESGDRERHLRAGNYAP